jgi:hypothetical protein
LTNAFYVLQLNTRKITENSKQYATYSISQFFKIIGEILYLPQQAGKYLECARAAAFFSAKRTAISNEC